MCIYFYTTYWVIITVMKHRDWYGHEIWKTENGKRKHTKFIKLHNMDTYTHTIYIYIYIYIYTRTHLYTTHIYKVKIYNTFKYLYMLLLPWRGRRDEEDIGLFEMKRKILIFNFFLDFFFILNLFSFFKSN